MLHTAAIFACKDGGIGVDAMGLRLARRREEAVELRIDAAGGRANVASRGACDSDIAIDDGNGGESKTQGTRSMRRKERF